MRLVLCFRVGAFVLRPALPPVAGPIQHGGFGAKHDIVLPQRRILPVEELFSFSHPHIDPDSPSW